MTAGTASDTPLGGELNQGLSVSDNAGASVGSAAGLGVGSGVGAGVGSDVSASVASSGGWQASVERTVTGLGFDLVDLVRSGRGLLQVFMDRVPGHVYPAAQGLGEFVTVDDCEVVTRQLLLSLEVDGVAYERLEVSSPGLDRLLPKERDFDRFAGQSIEIWLKLAFQNRKHWRGTLSKAATGWSLALDDAKAGSELNFTFDEVHQARLVPVIDFKGRRAAATPPAADGQAPDVAIRPSKPIAGTARARAAG